MPQQFDREGNKSDPGNRENYGTGHEKTEPAGSLRRLCEIRKHKAQDNQGDRRSQINIGALKIVMLLAMTPATDEQ